MDIIELPLSRGLVAIIDAETFPLIEPYGKFSSWWNVCTKSFYARARLRNSGTPGTSKYLHRIIMQAPSSMHVDHIDHDTLNNRRENLRLATPSQNQCNMKIQSRNRSGYKGVSFCSRTRLWQAKIAVDHRQIWLGRHATIEEAAKAYEEGAKIFHGDFRYLNGGLPSTGRNGSSPGPCKP